MINIAYLGLVYFLASAPSFLLNYHTQDFAADVAAASTKPEYISNKTEEFDYVIIGAGSAGAVIANRLSATGRSVLVLERGSKPSPLSSVPSFWLLLAYIDQGSLQAYPTVPQPELYNRIVKFIGGKVLGGGSVLNAMLYIRGSPPLYDEWARITGDSAWSWNRILPYFKRSEDYHGIFSDPVDKRYHGVGGPLHIERTNLIQPSNQIVFEALHEYGLGRHDLNADLIEGYQPTDLNIKKGVRWSTYQAFLEPAMSRRNLHVYSYATATQIHLDGSKKAYGVTYTRHGQTRFVNAKREIIVSAGAFESPKLLMLSGIGPRDDLAALGIEPKVNLPVGQALEDHLSLSLTFALGKNITFVPERDMTTQNEVDYVTTGYGPAHNDYATYIYKSSPQSNNPNYPDLQYFIKHQTDPGMDPVAASTIVRNDTHSASVFLVRPESVGSVKLSSSNPASPLIIDPKYLSAASDLPRFIEGIKLLVDLYENSAAFADVGAHLVDTQYPCAAFPYRSDEYWGCVTRAAVSTGFHYAGTCRMGKGASDPRAVVDSKLRVIGTKNLRVADASIMPVVPNANTNAPSIMIGERVSDFILFGGLI